MSFAAVTTRLTVTADFDPQLPARVLGRFTVTNELPVRFVAERTGEDSLRIAIELAAGPDAARRLAARLSGFASVRAVDVTFHAARRSGYDARLTQEA